MVSPYGDSAGYLSTQSRTTRAFDGCWKPAKVMDGDPIVEGELGYAYAVSGSGGRAREILQALLSRPGRGFGSALPISKVYFGLGEKERGFEWLKKAVEQHELSLQHKMDPVYDGLHPDPRFQALLRKMNLT